jgi:YesN/AraC family two-component response regulator
LRWILLVDDREVFLDTLADLASAAGFEVVGRAASGQEGCRLHDSLSPDVMLVDVQMPGMSGYEVAEHVRQTRPETNVVLISVDPSIFGDVISQQTLSAQALRSIIHKRDVEEAAG